MQVLRQALLQSLPAQIMQFTVIRNKILCLTQNQLILLCIDGICKKTQIPYNGSCVYKMQMSKDYIALLQRTGRLQIRRVDNLSSVLILDSTIKIVNNHYPRLKWWQDDLHLVYQKYFVTVNVMISSTNTNGSCYQQKTVQIVDKQKHLLQLEFTDLFNSSEARGMFYVFRNEIKLTLNDITVAVITLPIGEEIKQLLRLCHPFQQGEYNKQYLAVLIQSTKNQDKRSHRSIVLKVYNILTLTVIFEKQIYEYQQNQPIEVEMLTDQLSQYLLIKQYKRTLITKQCPSLKRQVETQTLLKVNSEYYYSPSKAYDQCYQPFIAFDIQIGLKKDMKLFLSHVEEISGRLCQSIDACYFENNQVHIVSIVLQVGYRNGVYDRVEGVVVERSGIGEVGQEQKDQQEEFVIWRELVEAKVNPNRFLQKLITASEMTKYNNSNHHHNYQKPPKHNLLPQSTPIGIEHESILQSLLTKLHKINNFNLVNEKIDAYQTMKKILAIEYFPMLLDVMTVVERDENRMQREILEKSNEDGAKTMSGCSSVSGRQSPRSDNNSKVNGNNQGQHKDICIINDTPKYHQLSTTQINQSCEACQQIQDHQNLELALDIINNSTSNSDLSLLKIQQSIHRMQTLTRYRLQRIQMKTRKQKKQSQKIVSITEDEFHQSLSNLQQKMLSSALRFTEKITQLPQKSISDIKQHAVEFAQTIQQKRLLYDNSAVIHKENHEELLDYLYDMEFPQVGFEGEAKAQSMFDYFNFGQVSKSTGVNRVISEMVTERQSRDEEFRMFSEFVMRNFI